MNIEILMVWIKQNNWNSKYVCEALSDIQKTTTDLTNNQFAFLLYYVAKNLDSKVLNILNSFERFDIDIQPDDITFLDLPSQSSTRDMDTSSDDLPPSTSSKTKFFLDTLPLQEKADAVAFLYVHGAVFCDYSQGISNEYLLENSEGNTLMHYLAQSNNGNAFSSFCSQEIPKDYRDIKNKAGKTALELALKKEHRETVGELYCEKFSDQPIYSYLDRHLTKHKKHVSNQSQVEDYCEKLLAHIDQLSNIIKIDSSIMDITVQNILDRLQIPYHHDFNGYEIPINSAKFKKVYSCDFSLYDLTPIGILEKKLFKILMNKLTNLLIKRRREQHDLMVDEAWDEYNQELENADEDNPEYDYDENDNYVRLPLKPNIKPFNVKSMRREIEGELTGSILKDLRYFKEELSWWLEEDMIMILNNAVREINCNQQLLQHIDYEETGINPSILESILNEMLIRFNDVDIKPGFLLVALKNSIASNFQMAYHHLEIYKLILAIITNCCVSPFYIEQIENFNLTNDDLERQKSWISIREIVSLTLNIEKEKTKGVDSSDVLEQLESFASPKKIEEYQKFREIIKVFPSDETNQLAYGTVTLPLNPIFKSLYTIAKMTYDTLTEQVLKSKTEKTNIVTAMLTFVASVKSKNPTFILIPLTFNYEKLLLSKDPEDGVFSGKEEFNKSVADDREHGGRIVGKMPSADNSSKVQEIKEQLASIIKRFRIPKEQMEQMCASVKDASVEEPLALEIYSKADTQKSIEFHHSERVFLHALKVPNNIKVITQSLINNLRKLFNITDPKQKFVLHSGALLFSSYPNSVCSECSLGFIALQDSYQAGFLKLFIDEINSTDSLFEVEWLQNTEQRATHFQLTVIGNSHKVFSNDSSGKFIVGNPGAKLDVYPPSLGEPAIELKTRADKPKKFIYEFTDQSTIHKSHTHIPYSGMIAMSGSKSSKITEKKQTKIEGALKEKIQEHNKQSSTTSYTNHQVLSFSNGHQLHPKILGEQHSSQPPSLVAFPGSSSSSSSTSSSPSRATSSPQYSLSLGVNLGDKRKRENQPLVFGIQQGSPKRAKG